jgi:hypothetical protein
MQRPARILLKALLTAVLGIFSVPTIAFGSYILWCWIRVHLSAVYYSDYWYSGTAVAFLGIGSLSIWATLYGVWRRSFKGSLFAIPIITGLVAMEMIPDLFPHGFSGIADTNYLSDVNSFFRVWYEENHQFPTSESEFREAMRKGPATWQYRIPSAPTSLYKQSSDSLPYEIIATGPRFTDVSQRPGVIYYCVASDLQEFWVTMTSLPSDRRSRRFHKAHRRSCIRTRGTGPCGRARLSCEEAMNPYLERRSW